MKNRLSVTLASGLIILAVLGFVGTLFTNPAELFQRIAIVLLIVAAIYFIARHFYKYNPEKKDQRAFLKAAKQSKKRLNQKSETLPKASTGSLTSIKKGLKSKKKSPSHLTVIEGKKSKKKNRVSF